MSSTPTPSASKSFATRVALTSVSNVASTGLAFVVAVASAKLLGAEDRGRFIALVTGISITSLAATLGAGSAGRRLLILDEGGLSLARYLRVSLKLSLGGAAIGWITAALALPLFGAELGLAGTVACIAAGGGSTFSLMVFESLNAFGRTSLSAALPGFGSFVTLLVLYLAFGEMDLDAALSAWAVGITVSAVAGLGGLPRSTTSPSRPTQTRELVRLGARLFPFSVMQALAMRLDRVLFPLLGGASGAGVYSIAATLSEALRFISLALSQQLVSRSARGEFGSAQTRRTLVMLLACQLALAVPLTIGVVLISEHLLGPGFEGIPWVFVALIPAELVMSVYLVYSRILLGLGDAQALSIGAVEGVVVMLVADVALIPTLGPFGAVIASALTYITLATGARRALSAHPR